ncbi:CHAT domain-containing protein [Aetokthonos hydrillicola Thurmond2011]|jgi:CHAT domain-containing protein/Flp pilus assembly protein TadD|uniref:CHAT domain-containing protein n=1 Tax=Aetokthonos hydrillicola Thurmond2011 TaxID=2712845 RepID=A0AAP5IEM5_9CYAN|nr:CHAT domain-containing tetratricopeptide repeat protein [Aetokthonos hydrillicola]MBO3462126.1 CHAT domain-containing protein [Aetokthonos hydrillicola CCALA 1050]MBW4589720.1 CHAT domain-containing protein [Aetokthonos hydrillicola CCALA 1050]MDR9898974.1 CHAT domain-containing protein [Aetokthonos hydrillicola Thurmond2011]
MRKLRVKQALILLSVLLIAGLWVLQPELIVGQQTPPASTAQSEELAEAERLYQQVEQLYSKGRYIEAIPLANRVIDILKKERESKITDVSSVISTLALLYKSIGRYSDAEPLYLQALEMMKRSQGDEHPYVVIAKSNLAALYQEQGRYSDAEPLYLQALDIIKRLQIKGHPDLLITDVINTFSNLATLYKIQGRYKDAESRYLDAVEMTKPLMTNKKYTDDISVLFNNLADLYQDRECYKDAESLYLQALNMQKKLWGEYHPLVATIIENLASLYESQGLNQDTEARYLEALKIRKTFLPKNHIAIATTLNNLAGFYQSQKRYDEAEALYSQSLEMMNFILGKTHPHLGTILINFANFYWEKGNINKAISLRQEGLQIQEDNLVYNLATGFERQKRDYIGTNIFGTTNASISLHLNSAHHNPDAARLALTTIFQRKGRILDVLTNSLQILRQHVQDSKTQELLTELSDTYSQLAAYVYQQLEKPPLEEDRKQLNDKAKQLEDKLSRRSSEFRQLSQSFTLSLESIQKLIPLDAVLIELVRYEPFNPKAAEKKRFGKPHYAAYVLASSGEPQAIDLGEAKEIAQTLEIFRESLRDSSTSIEQVKHSARDLDKLIMQPVRKLLGNKRQILVCPDGALNLIPFDALVDENNHYLVENYSFTYLTSGRDLLRLQKQFPSQQPPVIIADPKFAGKPANIRSIDLSQRNFPPLPGTAKEAEAIAPLFGGIKPLTGDLATVEAIKQVRRPRILHIATHGFFETAPKAEQNQNTFDDNPMLLSGLVLTGVKQKLNQKDGILTALETSILNLMGTKLVVLSACDTGLGRISAGEGIYGLRRALVIAGSESQVISLWKVNDVATKRLMVSYYQRVLGKEGRSKALQQIQLEMLRSKQYQHPYYWAAFIPSGDWRPMER